MREFHPVIDDKTSAIHERRIILGSFPTHPFTRKDQAIPVSKSTGFFYGGDRNQFWLWYARFIDASAVKGDVESLQKSLDNNQIAITDMILSCERKGKSASDADLGKRVYNHHFIQLPKAGETLKILCTSKGVMNDMFLAPALFDRYPELSLDTVLSARLQSEVLSGLAATIPSKPLALCLATENGGTIELVSLPSPGSPYRSLKSFGFKEGDVRVFLQGYLERVFTWFML